MNFNDRIMDGVFDRSFLSDWYGIIPELGEKEGELPSGDRLRGQEAEQGDEHFTIFDHNYLLLGGDNDRQCTERLLLNTCSGF